MKKLLIGFVLLAIFFPPLGQLAISKVSNAASRLATGEGIDEVRRWAGESGLNAQSVAGAAEDLVQREGIVARVVDGDTITLVDGRAVRLLQVDTPEKYGQAECYGQKASQVLAGLVKPGDRIRLAQDPALDAKDRYGRLLRYVWNDTVFVNARLIVVGAAAPYFVDGERGRYAEHFERYARQARASGLGFWGDCPSVAFDPYRAVATGAAS